MKRTTIMLMLFSFLFLSLSPSLTAQKKTKKEPKKAKKIKKVIQKKIGKRIKVKKLRIKKNWTNSKALQKKLKSLSSLQTGLTKKEKQKLHKSLEKKSKKLS